MLDISCAGLRMKNPLMLASGVCDLTKKTMERCNAAGAVVTKSVGLTERTGYGNPVVHELPCGLLNAVGLANPGIGEYLKEIGGSAVDVLIGSIFGADAGEFSTLAVRMAPHVRGVEMNMSCPHAEKVGTEYPTEAIAEAVAGVKGAGLPVFVKLGMENIVERAHAAVDGGADAVVAINTVKAMAISIETVLPVLGNRVGGYSGAGIKPIGVRCVYDLAKTVDVPVVGVGGIATAEDVIEYMMAGATAVQLGTVLYDRREAAFATICRDLTYWLDTHGYSHVTDVVGLALPR
jgi:dihydroorotate dehydrogenase (NAD+) catalytic subunit